MASISQPYDPSVAGMDIDADVFPASFVSGGLTVGHGNPSVYLPNFASDVVSPISSSGIVGDQSDALASMPVHEWDQTPKQSELQIIPYMPSQSSTQHESDSSSFQQKPRSRNSKNSTRKRLRSPEFAQERQLSSFRQKMSKKGIPEVLLCEFRSGEILDHADKGTRTPAQKKNKRDVEEAGGACFLCRVKKKPVIALVVSMKF